MNQKSNGFNSLMKSCNVVYPILIYFLVMSLAMNIIAAITVKMGGDIDKQYMMLQTIVAIITFPFIYRFYRKDKQYPTVFRMHLEEVLQKKDKKQRIVNGVLMFLCGATAGIMMNNVMAFTTLEEKSIAYQEVTASFFAGGVLFEILGPCLIIPLLEELLYRSVVYGRLSDLLVLKVDAESKEEAARQKKYRWYAILFTSLIFGVMHMNIVQFIYATILGIMLSWFVEKSGHLYGAVVAHIGANLMSVLRMETGLFRWMETGKSIFIIATVIFGIVTIGLVVLIWKNNTKEV